MSNSKTTWCSTFSKRSPNAKSSPESPPGLRSPVKGSHDLESQSFESSDTQSSDADSDDEHTLTAYGDISFSDICYISSTAPIHSSSKPSLNLRVRRPPMPKKRFSVLTAASQWNDNYSRDMYDDSWSVSPPTPSTKGQFSALLDKLSPSKPSFTDGISNRKNNKPSDRSSGRSKLLEVNESQAGEQIIRSKGMKKLPVRPPIPKWDNN